MVNRAELGEGEVIMEQVRTVNHPDVQKDDRSCHHLLERKIKAVSYELSQIHSHTDNDREGPTYWSL